MMQKIYGIIISLLIFHSSVSAQTKNWLYIKTEHYKVIFDQDILEQAERVANLLERVYASTSKDFSNLRENIVPVVINNFSGISNGLATPQYQIYHTVSSLDQDNSDWLLELVLHEGRHGRQFDSFFNFLHLPFRSVIPEPWLFEGDAVVAETKFSHYGRGRVHKFLATFRCNVLEKKNYSYSQNYLGDTENITANHYVLGYLLISYIEKKYIKNFLKKISEPQNFPSLITRRIKKLTGKWLSEIYNEMVEDLRKQWLEDLEKIKISKSFPVTHSKDKISDAQYFQPKFVGSKKYIAFKINKNNEGTFVFLDETNTEKLILKIISKEPCNLGFSYSKNKIAWSEFNPDNFRGKRGIAYNRIVIHDIISKKNLIINNKTNYKIPELSNDAKKIAALEINSSYKNYLIIASTENGEIEKRFPLENLEIIKSIKWLNESEVIVMSLLENISKIIKIDIKTGEKKVLSDHQKEIISKVNFYKNGLVFISTINGIDSIHYIDNDTKKRYILISSPYGIYNYDINSFDNEIVFQELTKEGMQISKSSLEKSNWIYFDTPKIKNKEIFSEDLSSFVIDKKEKKSYIIENYSLKKRFFDRFGFSALQSLENSILDKSIDLTFDSIDLTGSFEFYTSLRYKFSKNILSLPIVLKYYDCYPFVYFYINPEIILKKNNFTKDEIEKIYLNIENYDKISSSFIGVELIFPYQFRKPLSRNNVVSFSIKSILNLQPELNSIFGENYYKFSAYSEGTSSYKNPFHRDKQEITFTFGHTLFTEKIKTASEIVYQGNFPGFYMDHSFIFRNKFFFKNDIKLKSIDSKILSEVNFKENDFIKKSSVISFYLEYGFPIVKKNLYKDFLSLRRIFFSGFLDYSFLGNLNCNFIDHPKTIGFKIFSPLSIMTQTYNVGFKLYYSILGIDKKDLKGGTLGFNLIFESS